MDKFTMNSTFKYDNEQFSSLESNIELSNLLVQKTTFNDRFSRTQLSGHAVVEKINEESKEIIVRLLSNDQLVPTKKAASCLCKVALGDTVLLHGEIGSKIYILSVLENNESIATVIEAEHLVITTSSVRVETEEEISFKSHKLQFDSQEWEQVAHSSLIQSVTYKVDAISMEYTSEKIESWADITFESTRNATRIVSGTDRINALNIDYSAEFFAKLGAHTTMINGYQLLKTDGKLMMAG